MSEPTAPAGASFPPVDYDAWRRQVEKELKGTDFDKALISTLIEGIAIRPLYTAHDWPQAGDPSGFPGFPPFTRGADPISTADGWQHCQRCDHPDPAAANQALLADLAGGTNAVWLQLDRAARRGADVATPAAEALIGDGGVAAYGAGNLARVLDGVDLDAIAVTLDAGANALPAAAALLALLRERGADAARARLHFCADPLAALARDGALPQSLQAAERELALLAAHCKQTLPHARAVSVSTVPYHDAGAHAVQELAYALATGVHYLRALAEHGFSAAEAAGQMVFSLAVGRELFVEIAKLRAARLLWGKVLAACGCAERCPMYLHALCSARTLTQRDPWVNMLRVTEQTFAAIAGGADAITSAAFDEALGQPEKLGRRIARNTQTILAEESGIGRVVDPAGGSWFVETLTEQLARAAWSLFQDIERRGGMPACLQDGSIRAQIEATWSARRANIAKRKDAVTGVSEFAKIDEEPQPRRSGREGDFAARTVRRSAELRRTRGAVAGLKTLAAAEDAHLVDACIGAAAAGATIDEISAAVPRRGEAARQAPLERHRDAEIFEVLRDAVDSYAEKSGRPAVFLAAIGPIPEHKARSGYALNFFQAAGLRVLEDEGTGDAAPERAAAELAERFAASGARAACLCSSDDRYAQSAAAVARALKAKGAHPLLLAGRPGALVEDLTTAGVKRFIFIGCDVHATLSWVLSQLGVLQ
jgi:methylmalonyl-CoA mutase